jgi:hypothetical protein
MTGDGNCVYSCVLTERMKGGMVQQPSLGRCRREEAEVEDDSRQNSKARAEQSRANLDNAETVTDAFLLYRECT